MAILGVLALIFTILAVQWTESIDDRISGGPQELQFRASLAEHGIAVGPIRSPVPGERVVALRLDDFEDGDRRSASGLSWISVADDLMGGASSVKLHVTASGAVGSRHALRVSGDVAAGGFAGGWVALDGRSRATDISDFQGLRFRIRGNGKLQAGLRGGPLPGSNFVAPFEARPEWTIVEIPFESLEPGSREAPAFDPRSARWIGVSTQAGRTGGFEFELDDVELYSDKPDAQLRVQDGPTLTVAFKASPASELPAGPWKELAKDPRQDGAKKDLPDATAVSVCGDPSQDRVWFRIALAGPLPERWFGANLAMDVDGDPKNGMAWWGTNKAFHFDRLVTVWGNETGSGYEGMIGIAEADEVAAGSMAGSRGEHVLLVLDRAKPALVIGIPRRALGAGEAPVRLVAAVGSSFAHNDDVPDTGAALVAR